MKNELKSWEEAWADLDAAYSLPMFPDCKNLKYGYVFDEEKSVKWNAEQVEKYNSARNKEAFELQQNRNIAINEAADEICKLIVIEFYNKINVEQARVIYDMAYEDGHAFGYTEIRSVLGELIDKFKDFVEKGEQNGL